jgi:hypothetical protein
LQHGIIFQLTNNLSTVRNIPAKLFHRFWQLGNAWYRVRRAWTLHKVKN